MQEFPTHNFEDNTYIVCTTYDYPFGPYMEERIKGMINKLGIPYVKIEQRRYNKVVPRKVFFSTKEKDTVHYVIVVVVAPDTSMKNRAQLNGACYGFSYGIYPNWH